LSTHVYLRLFVFAAGLLLSFFWLTAILGHRRQRAFERILFFLCLALFFFYGGSLLALNADLHYPETPRPLLQFSWLLICLGLTALPALFIHLHVEYASIRGILLGRGGKWIWVVVCYAPLFYFLPRLVGLPVAFDFLTPINALGMVFKIWLALAFLVGLCWQRRFAKDATDAEEKSFHRQLIWQMAFAAAWVYMIHAVRNSVENTRALTSILLAGLPLFSLGTLLRKVQKFNFLQIGRQSNLIYAVVLAFVALLYLSLVRRVSLWFEPAFPPEATAAVLLFLPVVFFEPLQRIFRTSLRKTAHSEMDLTQRMMGPIQEVARLGNFAKLVNFIEQWAKSQFQLASVELLMNGASSCSTSLPQTFGGAVDTFPIRQANQKVGELGVVSHGAMLSGETFAALEFLCEQLPASFDLCQLIEEKLRLERELAERERLAALGQMAASISHNLKNPLGSIKTILQVQMESPEMPEALKSETRMVLGEISRLSNKLGQLLQFSRPTLLGAASVVFDVAEVVKEVGEVMRPEAERRGIQLAVSAESGLRVATNREAVCDILSNLVVNGLEAVGPGGHVKMSVARSDGSALVCVEDDGKGIPVELREKVMQPFFTTKTQGTGLGLAIVARRASEAGGRIELKSPAADGWGTKFSVWLPLQDDEATK
jgi:signal transduction histidine kinase